MCHRVDRVRAYISIHALLAESDYLVRGQHPSWGISIHALLAESDIGLTYDGLIASAFLSTLSLRRATNGYAPSIMPNWISIHALLAESDVRCLCWVLSDRDFYPRSPCGERPQRTYQQGEKQAFLSTLSLRRAT